MAVIKRTAHRPVFRWLNYTRKLKPSLTHSLTESRWIKRRATACYATNDRRFVQCIGNLNIKCKFYGSFFCFIYSKFEWCVSNVHHSPILTLASAIFRNGQRRKWCTDYSFCRRRRIKSQLNLWVASSRLLFPQSISFQCESFEYFVVVGGQHESEF